MSLLMQWLNFLFYVITVPIFIGCLFSICVYYPQVASSLSCKVPLWVHVSFSVPSIRSTVFGVFSILSGNNTLLLFCELINH